LATQAEDLDDMLRELLMKEASVKADWMMGRNALLEFQLKHIEQAYDALRSRLLARRAELLKSA
jgi:hypothetical protein